LILNRVTVAGTDRWGTNGFGTGITTLPSGATVAASLPNGFGIRDLTTAATPAAITVGGQPVSTWFAAQSGNRILNSAATLGLSANVFASRPTFVRGTGVLTTGGTVPTGAFFTAATHIGAFGTTDWTAGWSNFTPQTTDYSK
jgi:hypothetical protein